MSCPSTLPEALAHHEAVRADAATGNPQTEEGKHLLATLRPWPEFGASVGECLCHSSLVVDNEASAVNGVTLKAAEELLLALRIGTEYGKSVHLSIHDPSDALRSLIDYILRLVPDAWHRYPSGAGAGGWATLTVAFQSDKTASLDVHRVTCPDTWGPNSPLAQGATALRAGLELVRLVRDFRLESSTSTGD